MRIITGKARGVRLLTLDGDATRPTSERAKEAVFSILQFDMEGREILDLYAGSGQLGLEAISRGAKSATFVDKSKSAIGIIQKNIEKTKFENQSFAICSDVLDCISALRDRKKYDIVFIDPPYAMKILPKTLQKLHENNLLKSSSIIVCESGESDIFENDIQTKELYDVVKTCKYGIVHMTILKVKSQEE